MLVLLSLLLVLSVGRGALLHGGRPRLGVGDSPGPLARGVDSSTCAFRKVLGARSALATEHLEDFSSRAFCSMESRRLLVSPRGVDNSRPPRAKALPLVGSNSLALPKEKVSLLSCLEAPGDGDRDVERSRGQRVRLCEGLNASLVELLMLAAAEQPLARAAVLTLAAVLALPPENVFAR
mmetsp:Transcript_42987/g.113266  ORF Transcript_42987/g.113266 Transcript_42987/m.113266 type:complete len:180 (-) Transcript_42987:434-973(-)